MRAGAALDFAVTAVYTPDLTIANLEITPVAKDAAAVSGTCLQTLRVGLERIEGPGVFTATLVKQDGQWQFLNAHFSPAADFLPAPEPGS
ncbi:MAG: nuclear transport factor 2 family protein [Hyphomonas sp.]